MKQRASPSSFAMPEVGAFRTYLLWSNTTAVMKVTFMCLANSRKLSGRCVAGVHTGGEGWIRLVSRSSYGTLARSHYTLAGGGQVGLFDVVEVDVARARPEIHQPENWVLGRGGWGFIDWVLGPPRWKLIEEVSGPGALPLLGTYLSIAPDLLGDNRSRVSYYQFKESPAAASLTLMEPSDVRWKIGQSRRGRRQTRAEFPLAGCQYDLPVTDPEWERRLSPLPSGVHRSKDLGLGNTDRVFLTISLGEPFNGECFKLVAGCRAREAGILVMTAKKGAAGLKREESLKERLTTGR